MQNNEYRIVDTTNKEFKPLHKLLPYSLPYSIHIDPVNLCNFRCTFCPTGDYSLLRKVGRPKGVMSLDLFKKIINDIKKLSTEYSDIKISRLHLYKDGEPFINKNLEAMIKYAKESEVSHFIETTSNGSLITSERAYRLIESGLDKIRISIEQVSDAGYKNITQTYSNYEQIKNNVKFLFDQKQKVKSQLKIHVKIIDVNLNTEEKERFYNDFLHISDSLNIDELMGWSNSNQKDFSLGKEIKTGMDGKTQLKKREICPEPFTKLAINFDGKVSICCVDWSYGTIVGDLNNESFKEIWYGEKLKEFRILHLRKEKNKIEACKNCQYMEGLPVYTSLDDNTDYLMHIYNSPIQV